MVPKAPPSLDTWWTSSHLGMRTSVSRLAKVCRASAVESSIGGVFNRQGFHRGGAKVKQSQHYPPHLGTAVASLYRRFDGSLKTNFAALSVKVDEFARAQNIEDAVLLGTIMNKNVLDNPGWADADLASVLRHLSR